MKGDVLLRQTELSERRARGDAHLRLDEIHVCDLLGHRVLHLDSRIHLDENVLPRAIPRCVDQEFDGASVDVADRARESDGIPVQTLPQLIGDVRSRCDLDDLLVPPLDRAVPFEQVDRLPCAVGQDLNLDMPRAQNRLLEEHARVAEGAVCLTHRLNESCSQLLPAVHPSHAAPASAGDGLREERKAH